MRTMTGKVVPTFLLVWLVGLWCVIPGRTFPLAPPQETLAGLTPGLNTVADASRIYGVYNVLLWGEYSAYAGGPRGTNAYRWTTGLQGKLPGLIVETPIGSPTIAYVVVHDYPGLGTSRGLMALMPEQQVIFRYGLPDYAYDIRFGGALKFRELFYINHGLLVVLDLKSGRQNWMTSHVILTYPTYLRNAVANRSLEARTGHIVTDITDSYQVWVQTITEQPRPAPAY